MEAHDAVRSLAALAQPVRLQVFRALVVAGPEGMTPGALVDAIAVPGTSLSFHLKELLHSGMVTQERNGRHLIYRAAFGRMSALIGYLTENCCEGEACAASTAVASRG
jgi:DNA-binding transcriptional ArsR family regulator